MRLLLGTITVFMFAVCSASAITTTTTSFQKGDANGYSGVTELRVSMNTNGDGTDGSAVTSWGIDGYRADNPNTTTSNEFSPDAPSLTKFDNIFGNGPGQIPAGATILSATLTVKTTNGGSANTPGPWGIAALNQAFDLATTRYSSFPSADPLGFRGPWWEDGYSQRPQGGFTRLDANEVGVANMRAVVQGWSENPASNNGITIQAGFTGTSDGWNYYTQGWPVVDQRPKLEVTYTTSPVVTTTFQHGVNGYMDDTSAFIKSGTIQTASATNPDASVDDITYDGTTGNFVVSPTSTLPTSPTPPTPITDGNAFLDGPTFTVDPGVISSTDDSGLFKFGNVFGGGAGQAPADKSVAKAWLVLTTGVDSGNARSPDVWEVRAMSRSWDSTKLYSTDFGATPGFQPEDGDMSSTVLDTQYGMTTGSQIWFDVTSYAEDVRTNAITDNGLIVLHGQDTSDGWQIQLAQGADAALHPKLVVISDLSVTPAGIAGDYNNNGVVDAADYVVWRNAGATDTLTNDPTPGTVDATDYATWKANFGKTPSGSGAQNGGAVPEPTGLALGLIATMAVTFFSRRRSS